MWPTSCKYQWTKKIIGWYWCCPTPWHGLDQWLVNVFEKLNEPRHEKTYFMSYVNNKGEDQRLHFHCLGSIISLVSLVAISWLSLASVDEQVGLSLYLVLKIPEDRFSCDVAQIVVPRNWIQESSLHRGSYTYECSCIIEFIKLIWGKIRFCRASDRFPPMSLRNSIIQKYDCKILFEPLREKTCLGICDQVRHKPAYSATEAS